MAIGALVGLCVLLWLRLTGDGNKPALVAVPLPVSVSRSLSASPGETASVPAAVPAVPRAPENSLAPVVLAPASTGSRASSEAKEAAAPSAAKGPEDAVELPIPAVKVDHLGLARDAFNTRDWARAGRR